MLCYKISLRGHKGFENQFFQNASIELKLKCRDILSMMKQNAKVVQNSNFQNAPIELKLE